MGDQSQIGPLGGVALDSLADLQVMIGRLADPETRYSGDVRELVSGEGDPCLCVLAEFDETVLARRLEFRNGDGGCLAAELRNRRLHWAEFDPARGDGMSGTFCVDSLSYAGVETLQAFLAALRDFSASGGLSVRSFRSSNPADPDETGVSVAALRHLLAQSAARPSPSGDEIPVDMASERAASNASELADFVAGDPSWLEAGILVSASHGRRELGRSEAFAGLSKALDALGENIFPGEVRQSAAILLASGDDSVPYLGLLADRADRLVVLVSPSGKGAFLSRWTEWRTAHSVEAERVPGM